MRFGFLIKGAMLVALIVLFDWLFPGQFMGAAVGIFAAVWLGVVAAIRGGQWGYRAHGVIVLTAEAGIVHYESPDEVTPAS